MKERFYFGKRKADEANIYLYKPSWDCDWYWGFGYLGNAREHYHLNSYQRDPVNWDNWRNINMRDALLNDYDLCEPLKNENNLWNFCELALTAYALREIAEVYGRGGSHMTKNPLSEQIKNPQEVERINKILLPAIFLEIEKIFNWTDQKKIDRLDMLYC